MLVEEVAALFDELSDEQDPTFLTVAQKAVYFERGYARFRIFVSNRDPNFYNVRVTLALVNADTYDLAGGAVQIMGIAPTAARLSRLVRAESVDAGGNWLSDYGLAADLSELRTLDAQILLQGTVLYFAEAVTDSVRLIYVPVSAVDWTAQTPGDNEFIDELTEFHDLIALYSHPYYAIRDGGVNPALDVLTAQREKDLAGYLTGGRNVGASDHASWGR